MSRTSIFHRHGLTGEAKKQIVDQLYQAQSGTCAICGITQTELEARYLYYHKVYQIFHLDHCHETGRIRGLLCPPCNHFLGILENAGILSSFVQPGYQYNFAEREIWFPCVAWMEKQREHILSYLQEGGE